MNLPQKLEANVMAAAAASSRGEGENRSLGAHGVWPLL
jgi:hypothetical protein